MSSCPAVWSTFIWPRVYARHRYLARRGLHVVHGIGSRTAFNGTMPNRRSLIAAAIALALPAVLPALASAASASADPAGAITLRDVGSETNVVTVTLDAATR